MPNLNTCLTLFWGCTRASVQPGTWHAAAPLPWRRATGTTAAAAVVADSMESLAGLPDAPATSEAAGAGVRASCTYMARPAGAAGGNVGRARTSYRAMGERDWAKSRERRDVPIRLPRRTMVGLGHIPWPQRRQRRWRCICPPRALCSSTALCAAVMFETAMRCRSSSSVGVICQKYHRPASGPHAAAREQRQAHGRSYRPPDLADRNHPFEGQLVSQHILTHQRLGVTCFRASYCGLAARVGKQCRRPPRVVLLGG